MNKNNVTKKRRDRREKRKKIFLILIILLLMIVFGTVTYAWFSSNMKLTIDTMDININTNSGIQVSANGLDWSNTITKDDIIGAIKTYPGATNQLPETLAGCSTDGSVDGKILNMYYGDTRLHGNDGYYLTAKKQSEINCTGDEECNGKHYIAFDIFILLNENVDLVVTGESFVRNKNDIVKGGENSARVGFVNLGTTTNTVDGRSAQYLANATSSIIWEPNYDTHTEHGVENAKNTYGLTTSQTGGARLPYKGINSEITGRGVLISATDSDPHFTSVNPKISTVNGFSNDQEFTSMTRGITKLRIYFWLEGQDVDLENEVSGGELEFKLEIAIK